VSKQVIGRLESYRDYTAFALLVFYSILIVLSPVLSLQLGGLVFWVLLLVRWLRGEISW